MKPALFTMLNIAGFLLIICIFDKKFMLTICMFFGIIVRMYYAPKEHNPPHIHAYYQDYKSKININNGEFIEGQMPGRQLKLLQAWIEIHKDELIANWTLCQNGEKPFQIEPLK